MSEAPNLRVVVDNTRQPEIRTPVLTRASSVQPEVIDWIAHGYLAAGKLTILDGDPGMGKSTIATDWAAKITRGDPLFPGGERRKPRGVVFVSDEDGRADTLRPRFEAAGADLDLVAFLSFENADGEESLAQFPGDGIALQDAAEAIDAGLIVIDPLMLYLEASINANRDADVRRALNPITKAIEKTRSAGLILRHMTKGGGPNALYRGGGSIGIIGAARIGLMVARDTKTDESGRTCALACTKNNLAPFPPAQLYSLESAPNSHVARIAWLGVSERSADDMLDTEERSARDEAATFLRDMLAGGPVAYQEVKREARNAGISERTLDRAKSDLRIKSEKNAFTGGWQWRLPSKGANGATEERQAIPQHMAENEEERQGRQERQAVPSQTGVYICTGCQLPRALDTSACPSCGGREGLWR